MTTFFRPMAGLAVGATALTAMSFGALSAGDAMRPMPRAELSNFTNIEVSSLSEFTGNALLIEYFAYW